MVKKRKSQNVSKSRRVSLATGPGAVDNDHPLAMSGDGARAGVRRELPLC